MRKLRMYPDKILLKKSKPVVRVDKKIESIALDMVTFIRISTGTGASIALSAAQLGESVQMIAFLADPGDDDSLIHILINPEVIYKKKLRLVVESCCSLPEKRYRLKRYKFCKIRGRLLDGQIKTFRGRDTLAQVFQHEMDHCAGILINKSGRLL